MPAPSEQTPGWLPWAERLFALLLKLYPRRIRDAHGPEMQQAFRDRCREAARRNNPRIRIGWELLRDLAASLPQSHLDLQRDAGSRRMLVLLVVLCFFAFALATQPRWSRAVDAGVRIATGQNKAWPMVRRAWRFNAALRSVAMSMEASGDDEARAVAALLRISLYRYGDPKLHWDTMAWHGQRDPAEGETATRLAQGVLSTTRSISARSLATRACVVEAGCDRDLALHDLLSTEPHNAFNWSLEFARAGELGDEARMRAALDGVRQSDRYEDHGAVLQRVLFARALAADIDDEPMAGMGTRFLQLRWADTRYSTDLRSQCWQAEGSFPRSTWLDRHPEDRDACERLARLMTTASNAEIAGYGWRWLNHQSPLAPADRRHWREAEWLSRQSRTDFGARYRGRGVPLDPWTREEWLAWSAAWAPGDGETAALERWLPTVGISPTPPPDYRAPAEAIRR